MGRISKKKIQGLQQRFKPVATNQSLNSEIRRRKNRRSWHWRWEWSLPNMLTAFSLCVAGTIFLLHTADSIAGWPFHQANAVYNAVAITSSLLLIIMSCSVLLENQR